VAERHDSGVLDTCAYIDLDVIDPATLPAAPEITAITLAELQQGVAMAGDHASRAARMEKLGAEKAGAPMDVTVAVGSSGIASPHHLAGELLKLKTGIDIVHVPYRGGALSANDLAGGHIGMAFLSYSAVAGLISTGKITVANGQQARVMLQRGGGMFGAWELHYFPLKGGEWFLFAKLPGGIPFGSP